MHRLGPCAPSEADKGGWSGEVCGCYHLFPLLGWLEGPVLSVSDFDTFLPEHPPGTLAANCAAADDKCWVSCSGRIRRGLLRVSCCQAVVRRVYIPCLLFHTVDQTPGPGSKQFHAVAVVKDRTQNATAIACCSAAVCHQPRPGLLSCQGRQLPRSMLPSLGWLPKLPPAATPLMTVAARLPLTFHNWSSVAVPVSLHHSCGFTF
jgi:hypothetical protein